MPNVHINKLFDRWNEEGLSLTYADLWLKPGRAKAGALAHVSLESRFSRRVGLRSPLVSAAMDTVTESRMAIAMAVHGGLGTIHRNLNPKDQAGEVARVKFFLQGLIETPITVRETQTIGEVRAHRERKRYRFHKFPVLDVRGHLVGLVTRRHLEDNDSGVPVGKVMMPFSKLVKAKPGATKQEVYELMKRFDRDREVTVVPLVDSGRRLRGIYTREDLVRIFTSNSSHNVDNKGRLRVAGAIGVRAQDRKRATLLVEKGCDVLVIDTAHGHSDDIAKMLRWVKKNLDVDVVAGNVSTPEGAGFLLGAGADGVRVGQGPGSICTTSAQSGIGVMQASAVQACARALGGEIPVNADGGIRDPGDIVKALAMGAESVTLGSLLAGTDEAPGEEFLYRGRMYKLYRGMGSLSAMRERQGSRDRYKQDDIDKLVPEGVEARVPAKGSVDKVLVQYLGGLKAGFGYCGAQSIEELQETARMARVTPQGKIERGVHDVEVIE